MKALTNGFWGWYSFSLAVSSIYNLNDILDIKDDQADPVKTLPHCRCRIERFIGHKSDGYFDCCGDWFVFFIPKDACVV